MGFDHSAQAFPGGAEVVFEVVDAALRVVGFGGAGVAFGEQLPGAGFEVGDAGDQFGPVGPVDLGADLQAQPAAELVPLGRAAGGYRRGPGRGR